MQLTDPRPLLRQVSVERYQTLLASCRRMKAEPRGKLRERLKASTNPVVSPPMPPVVEPYLSVRKTTTPSTTTSIPGLEQEKPHSAPAQVIRSGVSRLGDFVDTDAVGSRLREWTKRLWLTEHGPDHPCSIHSGESDRRPARESLLGADSPRVSRPGSRWSGCRRRRESVWLWFVARRGATSVERYVLRDRWSRGKQKALALTDVMLQVSG